MFSLGKTSAYVHYLIFPSPRQALTALLTHTYKFISNAFLHFTHSSFLTELS